MINKKIFMVISLFAAFLPSMAAAAVSEDANINEIERVEVTGSRLAEDIKEVPAPAYVITKEDIDSSGARSVQDVLERIPGVLALHNSAAMAQAKGVTVRGLNAGGTGTDEAAQELSESQEALSEMEYYKDIDNVYKLLNVEPVEVEFGYSLIPLADESAGGTFIERVVIFRKQFALDMGMVFPSVRMRDNQHINPNQYVIKIKGEVVAQSEILIDHYLALDSGSVTQEVEGIPTIEPAFKIPALWVSEDKKIAADIAGYTLIDPVSVMITHLSEIIKEHAYELLSRQDVKTMLDKLKETNPSVVDDIVPNVVSVAYLQKVLALLLKEGVPIRDLQTILETLSDYSSTLKDIDITLEYVRQALKRTITRKFADAGQIRVLTLDTELENLIVGSVKRAEQGAYLALDPENIHKIVNALQTQIDKVKDIIPMAIILTSPVVRVYFKKLVDQFIPNVAVLSYNEIDNTVQIQAIGNIEI